MVHRAGSDSVCRRHFQLPPSGAPGIFAWGRFIGWISQANAQYHAKRTIRLRIPDTGPETQ